MNDRDKPMRIFRDLMSEIERHNPSRRGHGERVASHAVATAFELGMRDDELFAIRIASALHDYGKTRVARSVLEKPGPIDPSELTEIRSRVVGIAAKLANEIGIFSIEPMLLGQYERYDGLGFPGRSKGKGIALGGRIVCVCVAFDVMTHAQPWKNEKSEEEAIEDIHRNSGTQFDPEVVAAFSKIQPLITPLEEDVF